MRKLLWCLIVLAFLAAAQGQDFSKVQIKVTKVAGSVYMLEGAGGNIGVSVGEDGIVIVDDQYAPLAERIQAALRQITDKPVRFVINTHWHFDHTGGNAYFQKQGPIIAQENVRERMKNGAAGILLFVAIGFFAYRVGVRRATETVQAPSAQPVQHEHGPAGGAARIAERVIDELGL